MRKLIVFILATFLSQGVAFAEGLQASFQGSPNSPCEIFADSSSIACYDGTILSDGSLEDLSGCNLLVQSEDFGTSWTQIRLSVSTNVVKNPVDGGLTADALVEDSTAANSHQLQQGVSLTAGVTYTISVYAKPALRTWLALYVVGDLSIQYCDIENCEVGNTLAAFSPTARKVNTDWCRCSMSWTAGTTTVRSIQIYAAEGNGDIIFDGQDTTSLYVFGAQVREQRNVAHTNPGRYIATEAANKPWHDLAPTNAPGYVQGDFQRQDGNRITGRSFDGTNYYSKAHDASFNIFDEDHTITIVNGRTDDGTTTNRVTFAHGTYNTDGIFLQNTYSTGQWNASYGKAAASVPVTEVDTESVERVHILQVARRSDVATFYHDGTPGTPQSVSGYGIDANRSIYVGSANAGAAKWAGNIFFTHIQRRALSPHELAEQREMLQGILSSKKTLGATNVIADGDMEAAGFGSYSPNNCAPSKITTDVHQGTKALMMINTAAASGFVAQTITTVGKAYGITGFAHGDGGTGFPSVGVSTPWAGTTAEEWQKFDYIFVADGTDVQLEVGSAIAGDSVVFDDVYVYEYDDSQWDFSRSTTATQTYSTGTISEIAANVPRVGGKGGGLLVEGQSTTYIGKTEQFDDWNDAGGGAAVTADDHVAPDGTMTADKLDNTAGANNDGKTVSTADLGDLTGRKFTSCTWIRADTPHVVTLRLYELPGVGGTEEDVMVDTNWHRFSVTRTMAGGGNGTFSTPVYPGEFGTATGAAHFWGTNVVEGSFCPEYIPNPGAATSQVTRTADSYTIDPHPEVGPRLLPEEFNGEGVLTVEFDAKCEWGGAADIGATRYLVGINDAGDANNNFESYVSSTGRVYISFRDNSGTTHSGHSAANVTNYSEWFTIKMFADFSDLSRMFVAVNGDSSGVTYSNNNGSATFDTVDSLIRLGQNRVGAVNGFCHIRNLRIEPKEW